MFGFEDKLSFVRLTNLQRVLYYFFFSPWLLNHSQKSLKRVFLLTLYTIYLSIINLNEIMETDWVENTQNNIVLVFDVRVPGYLPLMMFLVIINFNYSFSFFCKHSGPMTQSLSVLQNCVMK